MLNNKRVVDLSLLIEDNMPAHKLAAVMVATSKTIVSASTWW